mmetsp:Transcript_14353/g.22538  ORF Transcript_14353/g.22538 Transcript_14353/m.22538 type:complete len:357 (-) Transcript_14353:435-1505(-)
MQGFSPPPRSSLPPIAPSSSDGVVAHPADLEARHGELGGEGRHAPRQLLHLGVRLQRGHKVLQHLAARGLDLLGQDDRLVEELGHLHKVLLLEPAGGERGRANAHAAGADGRAVAHDRVLVQRDVDGVADLLVLGAGEPLGPQVPQDQVVVRAARAHAVALGGQGVGHGLRVGLHLDSVGLELGRGHLLELRGHGRDLVLVRAALQRGEHGVVDLAREVAVVPAEEDQARPGPTQALVRGGRHHVAVLEGVVGLLRGHQPGDVRHVAHEDGAVLVRDRAELRVVPVARVGGAAAHDQRRLVERGLLAELLVVQQARLRVHAVGQRLEVHRGGRDGLARVLRSAVRVEPMGEMATGG